jgi:reverse gyrase
MRAKRPNHSKHLALATNQRTVQLLVEQTRMNSAARYFGVELEDALVIAEAVEIQATGRSSRMAHGGLSDQPQRTTLSSPEPPSAVWSLK